VDVDRVGMRKNEYEDKDKSKIGQYYTAFFKYCDILTIYIQQLQ